MFILFFLFMISMYDYFNLSSDFLDNDDVKIEEMMFKNFLYVFISMIGKIVSLVNLYSGYVNSVFMVLFFMDCSGSIMLWKLMFIWNWWCFEI